MATCIDCGAAVVEGAARCGACTAKKLAEWEESNRPKKKDDKGKNNGKS